MTWASEELSGADLGARRRNKRLVTIVEDLAAQPNESVPQASRDTAAMEATYEFWANKRIKASSIISAHTKATIERIKEHQIVLAIQDKTELDLGLQESRTYMDSLQEPLIVGFLRSLKDKTVHICLGFLSGNRRRTTGIGAISNQAAKGLHLVRFVEDASL
ncbi:MAG: transposase [Pleurocapsa sp. MO_226.B13]|nr:transposase [Pleurocapsa sp. MO_226.B13]